MKQQLKGIFVNCGRKRAADKTKTKRSKSKITTFVAEINAKCKPKEYRLNKESLAEFVVFRSNLILQKIKEAFSNTPFSLFVVRFFSEMRNVTWCKRIGIKQNAVLTTCFFLVCAKDFGKDVAIENSSGHKYETTARSINVRSQAKGKQTNMNDRIESTTRQRDNNGKQK